MRARMIQSAPAPGHTAAIPIGDFFSEVDSIPAILAAPALEAPSAGVPPPKPPKLNCNTRFGQGRDPVWTYCFCRRLIGDPRFAVLVASHRHILLVGALEFADVDGVFWPKRATWASVANEHAETVKRAVRSAEDLRLIERRPHGRPNGRQGSNTYFFDVALVRGAHDDMDDLYIGDLP
jgi:hypothetical protein